MSIRRDLLRHVRMQAERILCCVLEKLSYQSYTHSKLHHEVSVQKPQAMVWKSLRHCTIASTQQTTNKRRTTLTFLNYLKHDILDNFYKLMANHGPNYGLDAG